MCSESNKDGDRPKGSAPRIMIVDGDRLTRWSLCQFLEERYDVVEADCEDTALKELAKGPFCALIIGDVMAQGQPTSVIEQARRSYPEIQIIRTISDRQNVSNRSCPRVTVIEKPFSLEKLASVLEAVVGHPTKD